MKNLIKIPLYLFALVAIFFVSNFINKNIVFASNKVNINTADVIELDTLPGIGPAKAQAIIDYRNVNGLFSKIEDIMNVSGIGEVTFTNIKDFITVVTDSGDGDEDSIIVTATTTATTTDPIIATTTATTTIITTPTTTTIISVHYIQQEVSDYVEPVNIFELGVGRERLSYVGLPIIFEAKYKVSDDLKNKTPKYTWSLGDGFVSSDKEVIHIYKYPGEYNVVLNASLGEIDSISRVKVRVLVPNLVLSFTNNGEINISNVGANEINLYGLKIKSESQEYIFPLDTIISGRSDITFPAEYLLVFKIGDNLSLVDMSGKIIAEFNSNFVASNQGQVVTLAEFEKFILAYKEETAVGVSNQLADEIIIDNSIAFTPKYLVPMSASVLNSVTSITSSSVQVSEDKKEGDIVVEEFLVRSFWDKALHPIRTIKEAFY
jgi:competence ComEA-like helix-hairpin-helix protein